MQKNWKLKNVDEQAVRSYAEAAGLLQPIARMMAARDTVPAEDIECFLNPRLAEISDPFLLPDMERAAARVVGALNDQEQVIVFGDYDVDGVTSTALLTRFLRELGLEATPFVPDRLDEGYGLSAEALERALSETEASLVITVDCGTNSGESVALAAGRGADVIVTDHHEPDDPCGNAAALVNPKLPGKTEVGGLEDLCGAGVAFKLAHAVLKTLKVQGDDRAEKIDLKSYLDFVALGAVTDLVPLTAENRVLVRHGIAAMNRTRWTGLRALRAVAGLKGELEPYHLGFQLGPRINAAGRIGEPMAAVRLLTTDEESEARDLAGLLDRTNRERRRIEQEMTDEALDEIDGYFDPDRNFGLVVARSGWHPGVVGIVASRISRHYNRPTVVMGIDGNQEARGSCRSIEAYDILKGLKSCEELLTTYGGHQMAAGVALGADRLEEFKAAFNEAVKSELSGVDLQPYLKLDAELIGTDLTDAFYRQLQRLQPFGQDHPEPVWLMRQVEMAQSPRIVGQGHLKMVLRVGSRKINAIAFNQQAQDLPAGSMDIAFVLKENHWNGRSELQLQIRGIRPAAG